MLFNSTLFIFAFLPLALGVFFALVTARRSRTAIGWLVVASALFYGWSEPRFLAVLAVSVLANFWLGRALQRTAGASVRTRILVAGVVFNLLLLGCFKYAHFAVTTLGQLGLVAEDFDLHSIGLPLAISFFTFQQIAYLVDTRNGEVRTTGFLDYALFITFFPKLIAGPIVRHDEMLDQIAELPRKRFDPTHLAVGVTLGSIGLFKKVVLADGIGEICSPLYDAAAHGVELTLLEAWAAGLGYTLQVYFDFSGYSDMALGIARCFGLVLPLNFHSPYQATNISEFWRRWHITLTRWLQRYLFVPISRGIMRRGGERWDSTAVVVGQLVTMSLCGLWHGAGWNFVVWGALHGALLVGHDAWVAVKRRLPITRGVAEPAAGWLGRISLLAVLAMTFVIFRAADLSVALAMLESMVGLHGLDLDLSGRVAFTVGRDAFARLGVLLAIVWFLPNTQEVLADFRPALDARRYVKRRLPDALRWRPTAPWSLFTLGLFLAALYSILVEGHEEFIYRFF